MSNPYHPLRGCEHFLLDSCGTVICTVTAISREVHVIYTSTLQLILIGMDYLSPCSGVEHQIEVVWNGVVVE